ncbi:MAG TPA: regulatory iron-sulfur-containing complex subunit RicT [Planctomycetota bacterium]|nr:regulatory iron-sulfur-containing complex subunit RicT [Planctomycetota bacterium]HRU52291.1 regulatory iron-sulfur-containing complex subunit RicT [Planctomycetota bacterium]
MNSNIRSNQYACCANPDTLCKEEFNFCKKVIQQLGINMRLIQSNFIKEESKLIFFFTAPERVDFRELLKILRRQYYGTRIELRQIGQRDAASLLGGAGICGLELCCCSFLKNFSPITAKIAKKVGPTPNPAMYCGLCGRLRCCLRYEVEGLEDDDDDFMFMHEDTLEQEFMLDAFKTKE